ncbi:ankyrin repeat domain-containing protein, partial [Candidatus Bathyarchaeota archaeon]|nr:ankyrin repeat domain-containing protein [Candidatus Bathyarchaeota archaeon]
VNYQTWKGKTALSMASASGYDEIVQMLLDAKADPNIVGLEGETPLGVACHGGHTRVVQMLLNNKADPSILDLERRSPLSLASAWGFAEIVEILLRARPTLVDVTDLQGRSALHVVGFEDYGYEMDRRGKAPKQKSRTIEILLKHGANAALRTTAGETILHLAVKSKGSDCVPFLLQRMDTDDIGAVSNDGKTALDNAAESRNRDAVAMILQQLACSLGTRELDDALLAWAVEDERTHGILKLKLIRGLKTDIFDGEINAEWGALDMATYLGEYIMVQKLLRGLSRSGKRVEMIEHAIGVVDAAHGTTEDMTTTPNNYEDAIGGIRDEDHNEPVAGERTRKRDLGRSHTKTNMERLYEMRDAVHDPAKRAEVESLDEILARKKVGRYASGSSHRYMAIRALLKVAESSARTSNIAGELQPPSGTVDAEFKHEATIFDFYSRGSTSRVSRHAVSVDNVIYKQGPEGVMAQRRVDDKTAMTMVEELEWPNDKESQALKAEAVLELAPSPDEDFALRWIHLPANNVSLPRLLHGEVTDHLLDEVNAGEGEYRILLDTSNPLHGQGLNIFMLIPRVIRTCLRGFFTIEPRQLRGPIRTSVVALIPSTPSPQPLTRTRWNRTMKRRLIQSHDMTPGFRT